MYEAIQLKNEIIRNSIKLAEELELHASLLETNNAINLLDPFKLYNNALQIYHAIAENPNYESELRGEMFFKIWKLQLKKHTLSNKNDNSSISNSNSNLNSLLSAIKPEIAAEIQEYLILAGDLGYKPAIIELEQLKVNYSSSTDPKECLSSL